MDERTLSNNRFLNYFSRFSLWRLCIAAVVLFLIFGLCWWKFVYSNPHRVFDAMIDNSLRLRGVTKRVTQNDTGQNLDQLTQLTLTPVRVATSKTTLKQEGTATATVVTESIGTPTNDFVRYTSIDTTQKKQNGDALDFSKILGVWGNNQADTDTKTTDGELYNESVLGVVPFGNLTAGQRQELTKLIHENNIYEVDYSAVKKEIQNGRPRYTYTVKVDAEKYVGMLKKFAEFSGLNHLTSLDPASYAGAEKLNFQLTVDVWSRELTKVVYGTGERVEELSAHNATHIVTPPENPISVDELQTRLQSLQ